MTLQKLKTHFSLCFFYASLTAMSAAYAQTPFYQGKTITVIVGTSPAGTGDLRVKALIPYLRKHIPGNPALVLEYMDGGGGRKAANYMFRTARPDGLTIGAMSSGVISLNIMGESGVLYDLDKFIYLGAPETAGHQTIYTRKDLGADSLEKLRAKSGLRIGAQTVGHVSYIAGRFFAYFLDFKEPKFIAGYTAPEVDAALLRGELDARANAAVSVLRRNPDWLDKRVMDFHAIMEVPKGAKHPRLGHLPEIESFVRSGREKKLLDVWRVFRSVGSPYVLPPGTPKERAATLQEAMRKTLNDFKKFKRFRSFD
jgi:tripartite-type tricarboxylate transporter receptor subunit TctC